MKKSIYFLLVFVLLVQCGCARQDRHAKIKNTLWNEFQKEGVCERQLSSEEQAMLLKLTGRKCDEDDKF